MAEGSILIAYETTIGQFFGTHLTPEALRMPAGRHRLDHPPNDKLATFVAAGRKEDVEVTFAVLATLKLIENAILERTKALGASAIKRIE